MNQNEKGTADKRNKPKKVAFFQVASKKVKVSKISKVRKCQTPFKKKKKRKEREEKKIPHVGVDKASALQRWV